MGQCWPRKKDVVWKPRSEFEPSLQRASLVVEIPLPVDRAKEACAKAIASLLGSHSVRDVEEHIRDLWFTAKYAQTDLVVTNPGTHQVLHTIRFGISLEQARQEMVVATYALVEGGDLAAKLREQVWRDLEPEVERSKPVDLVGDRDQGKWRDAKAQVFNWANDLCQAEFAVACRAAVASQLRELAEKNQQSLETEIRQMDLTKEVSLVKDMMAQSHAQEQTARLELEQQQEYKVKLAIEDQKRRIRSREVEEYAAHRMRDEQARLFAALYS
ncbi:hypothetical protein BASA81_000505 [Batrachochytrium salamandrivorans]|nr:hypothetical protein BASA81_000505 [Batrachochytrium salamandrivorans]